MSFPMGVIETFPNQRLRSDCLGLCFFLYHFVLHLAILCESFNHRWVTPPPPPVLPCISVAVRQTQLRQENAFKQNGATLRARTILFSLYEGDIFVKYKFFFFCVRVPLQKKNTRNASIIRCVSQMPFSCCKCLVFCYDSPCFLQSS